MMDRPLWRRHVIALVAPLLAIACFSATRSEPSTIAHFDSPEIAESSALIASRQFDGVFWTLNDSGDRARIFAIDHRGKLIAEFEVSGATNIDWESMAIDDQNHLFLADIGNNLNNRRDLIVYRIPEPDPRGSSRSVAVDRSIRVRYPEQRALPDPGEMNYDAEALFWTSGALYVLTKHRSDHQSVLYRFPTLDSTDVVDLVRISRFDTKDSMVTAASVTADGRYLAVLTYHRIYLFEKPDDSDDYLSRPLKTIEFDKDVTQQCEGMTWDGDDLYFTNEQMELHHVIAPLSPAVTHYP